MDVPLVQISPDLISFDPQNPRSESSEKIETDYKFTQLKKSIELFGVFVPLIVRQVKSKTKPYRLVDGERRLRAALACNKPFVPVHIIDGNGERAKVLAYQIHMNRKDWTKLAELKSIKDIVHEIKLKNDDDDFVRKELCDKTSMDLAHATDILTILKYDSETIKKVEEGLIYRSYFIELERYFIPALKTDFLSLYNHYGEKRLRKILSKKAEEIKLGKTSFLRNNFIKPYFENIIDKPKLRRVIKDFLDNPDRDLRDSVKKLERRSSKVKKASKKKSSKQRPVVDVIEVPDEIDHLVKLFDIEKLLISSNVFDSIFNNLKQAIVEFERRTGYLVTNEIKLQNVIYTVLRSLFKSTEFENPTGKVCSTSSKVDFILKKHGIVIEIKYVRDRRHAKNIHDELAIDYARYRLSPDCNKIINYVYDPNNFITNPDLTVSELKKSLPEANHYVQ
ncbi:ParB N-terminal domain-containing protein [Candidatus Woesearchaeota archaeon]|nr:ParB N-terminal domain-containing protein [Candidatus Woesearchaeota archaeon]